MTATEILTVQQFGRALGRVIRAASTGQPDLWVSAQVWVPLAGIPVRPPVAVVAGALPLDGRLTRLPLLVVQPSQPQSAPDPLAWAAAGVPCWEVGASAVRIWWAGADGNTRCDVRRDDDVLLLPNGAGAVHARDLVVAGAAARVRRPGRDRCDCCGTPASVLP